MGILAGVIVLILGIGLVKLGISCVVGAIRYLSNPDQFQK